VTRAAPEELKAIIRDFRRDQIVDVARRLFGARGTTEVSMDDIAAEAGVARSTVYVYFATRDELLRACLQRMHALLLDDVVASWEGASDAGQRLRALVAGMLERIDDDPAFFRLAVAAQGTADPAATTLGAELSLIGLDIARLITDIVTEGVAEGLFGPVDVERATAFIGQQLFGAMSVRAGEPAPGPVDETAAGLCEFLLHGLGGVPAMLSLPAEDRRGGARPPR